MFYFHLPWFLFKNLFFLPKKKFSLPNVLIAIQKSFFFFLLPFHFLIRSGSDKLVFHNSLNIRNLKTFLCIVILFLAEKQWKKIIVNLSLCVFAFFSGYVITTVQCTVQSESRRAESKSNWDFSVRIRIRRKKAGFTTLLLYNQYYAVNFAAAQGQLKMYHFWSSECTTKYC